MTINKNNTESSQANIGVPQPPPSPGQTESAHSRGGNAIIKSGPLFISSKGIGWTSWKKRWFILTKTSLVFFRSDPSAAPQKGGEVNLTLGGIDLNNSGSVVVKADKKLLTVLFPDGRDGRAFTLKAETSEDLHEWKNALECALAQAPNTAPAMGQNGILKNDQEEEKEITSEHCMLKDRPTPPKITVIGRPILLALEDVDGAPSFLEKALRFIEDHGVKVEGIFRQAADVDDVERRIREYEQGKNEFSTEEDAHIVGDCIKYFLRELPSSPVPASCCNALVEACRNDRGNRVNAMRAAILESFPEPNRHLLQRILSMMQKIASHKAENRMNTSAVAACMAPLLLRPLLSGDCEIETDFDVGGDGSVQLLQAAAAANHAQAIVITLLEEYDNIFRVTEGTITPGLYSDSEEDDSEDEEVTDDEESYEDDDLDDEAEESDAYSDYDDENESSGTCSESGHSGQDNLSEEKVCIDHDSGSKSPEVDNDSKAQQKLPSSSIETSLPLHDDVERSMDILDRSKTNESGPLVGHGSKETTFGNNLTCSNSAACIQKSISNGSAQGSRRHRNFWGRTSARKNLSMESIDYSFDDDVEIQKLEASKVELQNRISEEAKNNLVLQANLEERKKALYERRQLLEQDVARLQEQLCRERDKRTVLEAALNKSHGSLPATLVVDEKIRADIEEMAQAEGDISNLKQKLDDLNVQLNQQRDQNHVSAHDSRNKSINSSNHQTGRKDKQKDTETADVSHLAANSGKKETSTDRENEKKLESSPAPNKNQPQSQQSDSGRGRQSRSNASANSVRITMTEGLNSTTSALTKLTTRLNFLKERRTQIANELHNMDKGRTSNQTATTTADKGRGSESRQSNQNVDKNQGPDPEKGRGSEGLQSSQNPEKGVEMESQYSQNSRRAENAGDTGRSEGPGGKAQVPSGTSNSSR